MLNYEVIESYGEMEKENKEIFRKYFLNTKTSNKELIDIIDTLTSWNNLQCEIFTLLFDEWYNDPFEVFQIVDDENYIIWNDCNNMSDVAYYICHEYYSEMFNDDSILTRYFDYDAFGRDLEIEGTFFEFDNGYIEIIK